MNIKFGVFWKQNLGTIYKDNSITTLGKEADVDLNLSEVSSIHANFKVDGKNYTSIVYIVDIEKGLIRIPFTREVLSIGMHELELVAVMKNGDVIPSQTFTYNIVESLDNLEDITEETNYPILIQLLQDVNSKIAEIDDAIARIPSPEELKGEKGDKGDKGEQGIQGERGLQGIQGIRGEKGDKGDRGLQGIQGVKGEKGDKGERGERGLQGIQGNQGARGIQGEKGDKGETGVGLGFEWSGTKLGIKKDTDISYKYVELKGAKGEQGVKGEKGETPSIAHLEKQVSDKSKELDTKFNTLTAKQQQDAEVVMARDGEVSLNARLERDLAKGKIHFVNVEGSNISVESEEGYLENVEIHGNTWQDSSNLTDIRSVGAKVEGQELYEIDVVGCGKNLLNINSSGTYYGVTFSLEKNVLSVKGTGTVSILKKYSIKHLVEEGRTYVLTSKSKNSNVGIIDGSSVTSIGGAFVAGNDVCIYFQIREGVFVDETIELQLEEGTVATPYELYKEDKLTILSPTPLEKVGDVADRIICKDGVWGVEKNNDEIRLDEQVFGTNDVSSVIGEYVRLPISYSRCSLGNSLIEQGYCITTFGTRLNGSEWNSGTKEGIYIGKNAFGIVVKIETIGGNTKTHVKNYFLNKNHKFKRNVETSQFIPLPHSQQIKLKAFAERTHITCDTEIQPTIKAQVPKSLGATVNTHTTQIDNLNKELDRVKKLEESTVSTVTSSKALTTIAETSNGYFEDVKLEGKTLVNLSNLPSGDIAINNGIGNGKIAPLKQLTSSDTLYLTFNCTSINSDSDLGIIYSVSYKDDTPTEYKTIKNDKIVGYKEIKIIPKSDIQYISIFLHGDNSSSASATISDVMLMYEKDYDTQNPPSYFEGLKSVGQDTDEISVESVNENLLMPFYTGSPVGFSNLNAISFNSDHSISYKTTGWGQGIKVHVSGVSKGEKYLLLLDSNSNGCIRGYRGLATGGDISCYDNKIEITAVSSGDAYIVFKNTAEVCDVSYTNARLVKKSSIDTKYKLHKKDKKQILYYNPTTQTWEKPILREWDSIEKHSDGKYYYHKRSGEVVLNGSENWRRGGWTDDSRFELYGSDLGLSCVKDLGVCDKLKIKPSVNNVSSDYVDCITIGTNSLSVYISSSKLTSNDLTGGKQWLQANPVTVVYQLAQEEVYECTNLDLITYSGETNLIVSSGAIQPKLTLKVLSNVSNVVKLLQEKVSILENKFIKGLKQVLAGDMMSLAHLLYPEDFENNHEMQTLEL